MNVRDQTRYFADVVTAIMLLASVMVASSLCGQDVAAPQDIPAAEAKANELRINFDRTPWRFVIDWIAEEAGLAVHVGDVPTGSFTYSDDRAYTPDEAISRINLFLIPERHALVRSGSLLTVLSLDSEQSIRQLDAMSTLIDASELPKHSEHDVAKCIFSLGEVEPEIALQELTGLLLLRDPVVLKSTRQLMITETVGKLRLVQKVLEKLTAPKPIDEGPVERFALGSLDPDRVLAQVRPHVGLDPLAMIGTDISLSIDDDGRQILASGTRDKLDAIASVIASLEGTTSTIPPKQIEFRSHELGDSDVQTVVSVLQTLLADEDVRLAPDLKSNQVAVLGDQRVHDIVEKTITQLANKETIEFKAIRLGSVDPRYAVTVLSDMFGIVRPSTDPKAAAAPADPKALKIEADLFTQRLFVRGSAQQIAEIEKAVEQLTDSKTGPDDSTVRMLPYQGERARQILESATQFWPHDDEILIVPGTYNTTPRPIEQEINPEPGDRKLPRALLPKPTVRVPTDRSAGNRSTRHTIALVNHAQDKPPRSQIKVQWTPQGILVQASDPETLKRFEDHLRMIAGPDGEGELRLSVYYLKHVDAEIASQLLQDILDAEMYGEMSDSPFGLQSLLGADSSGLDEYWTSGTATVIPDKRLNRIFVYGTAEDLADIQKHLEVIDRETSLANVKTFGSPRVIKLDHAKAPEVAEVIRDAYAGRIAATAKERQAAEQRKQQAAAKEAKSSKQSQQATPSRATEAPTMTLAVEEQTNSLIVTAPEQLASEVEELIRSIDQQATQRIEVRSLGTSAPQVHELLMNLLAGEETTKAATSNRGAPAKSTSR